MDMVFPEYNSTTGFRGCYKDFDCSVPEGMDPCTYAQEPRHIASYYTYNYPKSKKGHWPFVEILNQKSINTLFARTQWQFVTTNPGYWFLHYHI